MMRGVLWPIMLRVATSSLNEDSYSVTAIGDYFPIGIALLQAGEMPIY